MKQCMLHERRQVADACDAVFQPAPLPATGSLPITTSVDQVEYVEPDASWLNGPAVTVQLAGEPGSSSGERASVVMTEGRILRAAAFLWTFDRFDPPPEDAVRDNVTGTSGET
jgi:hypothetical protein